MRMDVDRGWCPNRNTIAALNGESKRGIWSSMNPVDGFCEIDCRASQRRGMRLPFSSNQSLIQPGELRPKATDRPNSVIAHLRVRGRAGIAQFESQRALPTIRPRTASAACRSDRFPAYLQQRHESYESWSSAGWPRRGNSSANCCGQLPPSLPKCSQRTAELGGAIPATPYPVKQGMDFAQRILPDANRDRGGERGWQRPTS
jgi:hypothetical protein